MQHEFEGSKFRRTVDVGGIFVRQRGEVDDPIGLLFRNERKQGVENRLVMSLHL